MGSSESKRSKTPRALLPEHRPKTLPTPPLEYYEQILDRLIEAEEREQEACVVVELTRPGAIDLDARLRLLEDLAGRIGVDVRYEALRRSSRLASSGGLCKLRSQYVILVDEEAPVVDQVGVLREALSQPELSPLLEELSIRLDLRTI